LYAWGNLNAREPEELAFKNLVICPIDLPPTPPLATYREVEIVSRLRLRSRRLRLGVLDDEDTADFLSSRHVESECGWARTLSERGTIRTAPTIYHGEDPYNFDSVNSNLDTIYPESNESLVSGDFISIAWPDPAWHHDEAIIAAIGSRARPPTTWQQVVLTNPQRTAHAIRNVLSKLRYSHGDWMLSDLLDWRREKLVEMVRILREELMEVFRILRGEQLVEVLRILRDEERMELIRILRGDELICGVTDPPRRGTDKAVIYSALRWQDS
jgi:hypothetical protein